MTCENCTNCTCNDVKWWRQYLDLWVEESEKEPISKRLDDYITININYPKIILTFRKTN